MDFIRILRSLEEFLYEVMTWLVFYPRTLLRSAIRPLETLEYSRTELHKPEEEQYGETLSPPLFLMLSLVISHLIELGLHLHPFASIGHKAEKLFGSDQNLVILRSLMFAAYPLMFALQQVKEAKQPLTRKTLRGPFFGECYPASVFCLLVGISGTIAQAWPERAWIGAGVVVLTSAWYVGLQTAWTKRSNRTWRQSLMIAIGCFLKATLLLFAASAAITFAVVD